MDRDGNPTTDPEAFYGGGAINTMAGHKGYALSVVAELISRYMGCGETMTNDDLCFGAFLMVVNLEAFRPVAEFQAAVGGRIARIRAMEPAEGFTEVLMPGDPEQRTMAKRLVEGIVLPDDTIRKLSDIAAGYNVAMPAPVA
jgi:LDH2 family malate/lactate/ureidoglycolate dehydrogenase